MIKIRANEWVSKLEPLFCSRCDAEVDPAEPESGDFYAVCGHVWLHRYGKLGDWEQVVFAVCADCQQEGEPCAR